MSTVTGLFGTCGNSKWRDDVIRFFTKLGPWNYYNPQVPDGTWDISMAAKEAEHLATDDIIVVAITDETFGYGSLAEAGLVISQIINSNDLRYGILYIAPDVNETLKQQNPQMAKESYKARKLVLSHLENIRHERIIVLDNIKDIGHAILDAQNIIEARHALREKWGNHD